MIVVKPQQENCDFSYNILFPDPGSISFFESYDELINSIFYEKARGKDNIDIRLPIKDINYVRIFNFIFYILI